MDAIAPATRRMTYAPTDEAGLRPELDARRTWGLPRFRRWRRNGR